MNQQNISIKTEVEEPSPSQRKLHITVEPQAFDAFYQKELQNTQKNAKVKGFREGKVPLNMVEKFYGQDIKRQVLKNMVDQSYSQAVGEKGLKPVSQPQIEPTDESGQLLFDNHEVRYIATFEVLPDIELKEYKGFKLEKTKVEVTDQDIEQVLQNVQDQRAQLVPVNEERGIQNGDYAEIEYEGGIVTDDGVRPYEGMKGEKVLEIGSGQFIPGFEEKLIGAKAGEDIQFRLTFPEDYSNEDLQGKEVEFSVKVHELKVKEKPELSDDLAKELHYESLEDMKEQAKKAVQQNREKSSQDQMKDQLLGQLIEANPFEMPQALIQAQYNRLCEDWKKELKQQGYPDEMIQQALEQQQEQLMKQAESSVRSGFLLDAIAKKEQIDVNEDEIGSEIKRMAQEVNMEPQEIEDHYKQNPKQRDNLKFRLQEEKTIQFLMEQSNIKEVEPKAEDKQS